MRAVSCSWKLPFASVLRICIMYLQACPKVKGSNPLQHTAMEMGVWLGLVKQKDFSSVLYIQAYLCETEVCVLNSSVSNKRKINCPSPIIFFFQSRNALDSRNQISIPRQIFCFFSLGRVQILWETGKENQFKEFL